MNTNRGDFLTLAAGAVGIFGGVFGVLYWVISSLSPSMAAAVLCIALGIGLSIAGPALYLVNRLLPGRRSTEQQQQSPYLIDAEPAQVFARPRQKTITVPTYTDNGDRRPLLNPGKPAEQDGVIMLRSVIDGAELTVPARYAARFARLTGPSRSEWVGSRAEYGAALSWFKAHGMLRTLPSGGATWRDEYADEDTRVSFVSQFCGDRVRP